MSRTKHTETTWSVAHPGNAEKCQPAIVLSKHLKILIDHSENFGDPLPDARLVASAPDLLEACEAIESITDWTSNEQTGRVLGLARYALKKVRG